MLKDINPDTVDEVISLLSSWEGPASEIKLKERLGEEKAKALLDLMGKKKASSR